PSGDGPTVRIFLPLQGRLISPQELSHNQFPSEHGNALYASPVIMGDLLQAFAKNVKGKNQPKKPLDKGKRSLLSIFKSGWTGFSL
ncbi:MAG TPA: hypothetical protein VEI04_09210, partial [Syntrophobacteria bacterium]|nr:hypothetical protein [Syntrophobacteria bacterium]